MKRLLAALRQWLAGRPQLRRRLTLIIHRLPALDMRLRSLLHGRKHHVSPQEVDAGHASQAVRDVVQRLRARMPHS